MQPRKARVTRSPKAAEHKAALCWPGRVWNANQKGCDQFLGSGEAVRTLGQNEASGTGEAVGVKGPRRERKAEENLLGPVPSLTGRRRKRGHKDGVTRPPKPREREALGLLEASMEVTG